jgi:hypothetical protein
MVMRSFPYAQEDNNKRKARDCRVAKSAPPYRMLRDRKDELVNDL